MCKYKAYIMFVKIIHSTDRKFIGSIIPLPKSGDIIKYNGYIFDIIGVNYMNNSIYKIWTYNYIIICKVINTMVKI